MIREILSRYLSFYVISLDLKHFALIFYFPSIEEADWEQISNALNNACSMIHNYFSVWMSAGIGSPVEQPMLISRSYQEARQAAAHTSPEKPIAFLQGNRGRHRRIPQLF